MEDEQLTEHFSLFELTVTDTGLDNTPDAEMLPRLKTLAIFGEKVRAICDNKPITVNSAFRSPAVNEAVGGVSDSAHALAYAMDFTCAEFGTTFEVAKALDQAQIDGKIEFDQLIYEGTWVHISRDPRENDDPAGPRGMRLTHVEGDTYTSGLIGP